MNMNKKFTLSRDERAHFNAMNYTIKYLENSVKQFMGAVITERLGYRPNEGEAVEWKLSEDGTELEVNIHEQDSIDRPASEQ